MCGATSAQQQLQQEQIQAYQQAQQLTAEQYANQQAIYGPMSQMFQSIFSKGPSQEGFSDAEKNDLETGVVEGTAQNYANAAKAVNEQIAANGGDTTMPSGAADEMKLETANSSAAEKSKEELQVNQADWEQGYNEWQNAGQGLQAIAAGDNPLGFENAETSSGSAASTTADQIAQEQNGWINAAIGGASSIASAYAGKK